MRILQQISIYKIWKGDINMNKEEITLKEIVDHYINSSDYNGLPIYNMKNYSADILSKLILNDLVLAISEKEVINPHIKYFDMDIPYAIQINNISSNKLYTVLYPTDLALKDIEVDHSKPYSIVMKKGAGHLDIIYFDIEILERYVNNPMFMIMDNGYRGSIVMKDEHYSEDYEHEYIKDFGMALIDEGILSRAVGVFVSDLAKLSDRKQMLWKSFELTNQDNCHINPGFIKNLILGEWVDEVWIFHALIEEIVIINKQCRNMEIPELFRKEFGTHFSDMPEGYRNIFLPTLKNYYDFILVLEKVVIHNISIKTFQKSTNIIKEITRNDEEDRPKGSLNMLDEWLNLNIKTKENISEIIVEPLRTLRKARQKPAHELIDNKFDKGLYQKQNDMVSNIYSAVRGIRLLFSSHPSNKDMKIPEQIYNGDKIVNF